ncbi:MAG TPA: YoaK family protein [Candidatus Acidoferrum sp.]|nr:YoaK family protein [Candidatus Acidoferrum sp.]
MPNSDALAEKWLTFGLAFVGGYGDAAGLVLAKTFTGHVTGNLVLVAISLVSRDERATLAHFVAIGTFLFGVFLSILVAHLLHEWPSWSYLPAIMSIEVILIGVSSWAMSMRAAIGVGIFIVCVSLALGLQNGALRRTGGISVHTTYLTGMITRLITTEADKIGSLATAPPPPGPDPTIVVLGGIWASFALGAATGAATAFQFRDRGILGVAFILLALIVRCLALRRKGDAAASNKNLQ